MRARKSKKRNDFFSFASVLGENRTYSEPILGVGRFPNLEVEANQRSNPGPTEPIPNRRVCRPGGSDARFKPTVRVVLPAVRRPYPAKARRASRGLTAVGIQ